MLTARAQLGKNNVNTFFVDRAQRRIGEPQAHPAILALDPESAPLQVGHDETALDEIAIAQPR